MPRHTPGTDQYNKNIIKRQSYSPESSHVSGNIQKQGNRACIARIHTYLRTCSKYIREDGCGEEDTAGVRYKGENLRKQGSNPVERVLSSVRVGTL